VLNADVLEVASHLAAVHKSGHDCHVSVTALAFSDVDLEYLREHFAPAVVLNGLCICVFVVEVEAFFDVGLEGDVFAVLKVRSENATPFYEVGLWRRDNGAQFFNELQVWFLSDMMAM